MENPRPSGPSSAPPSPTSADSFGITGPSEHPDPAFHAYRRDLADVALAGHVMASHYARGVERATVAPTLLRAAPAETADVVADLPAGAPFFLIDDSRGWAWGYAGPERRVGYISSEALDRR